MQGKKQHSQTNIKAIAISVKDEELSSQGSPLSSVQPFEGASASALRSADLSPTPFMSVSAERSDPEFSRPTIPVTGQTQATSVYWQRDETGALESQLN